MITVGIDLAAEASRTALAVVTWSHDRATLTDLSVGVDDARIRREANRADKVGVDCPFGWPTAFIDVATAHHRGTLVPPTSSGRDWRRPLTMRETDLDVHTTTGLTPLSVSADRIAHAAFRWAAIAAALTADGHDCARDGSGLIAEVYPAAALNIWKLPYRGYKRVTNRAARNELVDLLRDAAPWLDLGNYDVTCRESDDALDAVICALIARAVWLGQTRCPPAGSSASAEGWIHLPNVGLAALV